MTQANHTPGPWKALGLLSPFGWVIKYDGKDGKESIAYIQAYDIEDDEPEPYGPWDEENKANHDLVLAAPELLDANIQLVEQVKQLLDQIEKVQRGEWKPTSICTSAARAVAADARETIAKATGGAA